MQSIDTALEMAFAEITSACEHGPTILGAPTGFKALDRILCGIRPGEITHAAATTLEIGTAFLYNVALNAAKAGEQVLFLTLNASTQLAAEYLLSVESSISLERLHLGKLTEDDWDALSQATNYLNQLDIQFFDYPMLTTTELMELLREAINEGPRRPLIVVESDDFAVPYLSSERSYRAHEPLYSFLAFARAEGVSVLLGDLLPDREGYSYTSYYFDKMCCAGSILKIDEGVPTAEGAHETITVDVIKNSHGPKGSVVLLYNPATHAIKSRYNVAEDSDYEDIGYEELKKMFKEENSTSKKQ